MKVVVLSEDGNELFSGHFGSKEPCNSENCVVWDVMEALRLSLLHHDLFQRRKGWKRWVLGEWETPEEFVLRREIMRKESDKSKGNS